MEQLWLITVPNNKQQPSTALKAIKSGVPDCQLFRFEIPNLVVGTLDTLISLSDELSKVNSQVENVVRKVERQYLDLKAASSSSNANAAADSGLKVNENSVEAYLRKFQWDFARFQFEGKVLSELVGQVQSMAARVDDELKSKSTSYADKTVAVAALQRKKTIVLQTSDFEDFLSPTDVAKLDILDTENLLTVFVVVPKSVQDEFLTEYATIGASIAVFGGPDWEKNSASLGTNDGKFGPALQKKRASVKGSPVVPRSAKLVKETAEAVLYTLTLLKGHYEAGEYVDEVFVPGRFVDYLPQVKIAFREKKYVVREFSYDHTRSGGVDAAIEDAQKEIKQLRSNTLRWCKANFGEIFSAWVHLKVIRAFVESVLRYGLPVDFLCFFLQPNLKKEKELKKTLSVLIEGLHPELKMKKSLAQTADEEAEEDSADNLPFVCHKFPVIGAAN